MTYYEDRLATCVWHELKHTYPELAPPDELTPEERRLRTERDIDDLFGPEEEREEQPCPSRD